ncbi:MAG: TerD family protein [Sulfuricurvum sp.]|uniref:TerD family protein n=1 Tax=Sulfuricurvum sp. TaxID=2025608 RepID=UPI00260E6B77|nr:TerD family protein [Sulfuricurvum sp.]MDD5119026.1 TerD family protein [Sulfuricurvum sp.]
MQFSTEKLSSSTKAFQFSTVKGISSFKMTLNWEGTQDVDLSVFGLRSNGKIDEKHFGYVFFYFWLEQVKAGSDVSSMIKVNAYKTYETIDGALVHSADIKNGSTQSEDEWVIFTPSKVADSIEKLAIVASIHGNGSFGSVENTIFSIEDADTNTTIQQYDLSKNFSSSKIILLGELIKKMGVWEFQPIGDSHAEASLDSALKAYGVPM